jgi:hypothetical protein
MFILNRYDVTAPVAAAAAVGVNANPAVATGDTGDSANNDIVTTITATATYTDQIISKLVATTLNAGTLGGANAFNYIKVSLVNLGISGTRPVLAAQLLGVYNPASTEQVAAGATPSFIGWVAGAPTLSVHVVNSTLYIKVPVANNALFNGKVAMVQLFYSTAAGE